MKVRSGSAVIAAGALWAASLAAISPASADTATERASTPDSINVEGRVLVVAGEGGESDRYELQLRSGKVIALADGFTAEPLSYFRGSLAVPGSTAGRTLVSSARVRVLDGSSKVGGLKVLTSRVVAPGPAPAATAHTTYVAKITNFGTVTKPDEETLAQLAEAQNYWVRESNGAITSWTNSPTVVPVIATVGSAATGCGLGEANDFGAIAQSVATQAYPGIDFSGASPNHLAIVVPDGCGGKTAGRGRVGRTFASGGPLIYQGRPQTRAVLAHEFGHNFSLGHAKNKINDYGHAYEVMGSTPVQFGTPVLGTVYRWEQGVLAADEVADGSQGGTWTVAPRSATSGLRSVAFIDPDTGKRTFIDYRDGLGNDTGSFYADNQTGLLYGQTYRTGIVVTAEDSGTGAMLIDTNGDAQDTGAMRPGDPDWSNTSGSIKLRVTDTSTVQVTRTQMPPLPTGTAAATGSAVPFETMTATGAVAGATSYRYQWLLNGNPIPGAEDQAFRPDLSMVGGALSVSVTGYAVGRNPSPPAISAPVTIGPAKWYAFGEPTTPTISGTPKVGQTLTARGVNWVNAYAARPDGTTVSYQWTRDKVVIPGATAPTYTLTPEDAGKYINVSEIPQAPGYDTTEFARSSMFGPVAKARLAKGKIKIKGATRVGRKVKAKATGWSGAALRYRWFANGKKIRKATHKSLRITGKLRRKKIVVQVTARKPGYVTVQKKSRAKKVR